MPYVFNFEENPNKKYLYILFAIIGAIFLTNSLILFIKIFIISRKLNKLKK